MVAWLDAWNLLVNAFFSLSLCLLQFFFPLSAVPFVFITFFSSFCLVFLFCFCFLIANIVFIYVILLLYFLL